MKRLRPYLPTIQRYGTSIWLVAILLLAGYVVTTQQDDLRTTWNLIAHADPRWILAIVALEASAFVLIAGVYGLVLHQLGYRLGLALMISLHLQRAVINGLTPLGGPSSVVVFVTRLRQKGVPPADSLLAAFIKSVSGHVAFLLILIPALFVANPTRIMFGSAICLVALVTAMLTFLALIMRRRRIPRWMTSRIPRRGLRVLVQLRRHRFPPRALATPMSLLILFKLAGVISFWCSLRAVGWEGSMTIPLTVYVISTIFIVLAPLFQGIGIVDVGVVIALERLGVPAGMAISSTLISRVLGLWLPLAIGILAQFVEAWWARRRPIQRHSPAL